MKTLFNYSKNIMRSCCILCIHCCASIVILVRYSIHRQYYYNLFSFFFFSHFDSVLGKTAIAYATQILLFKFLSIVFFIVQYKHLSIFTWVNRENCLYLCVCVLNKNIFVLISFVCGIFVVCGFCWNCCCQCEWGSCY